MGFNKTSPVSNGQHLEKSSKANKMMLISLIFLPFKTVPTKFHSQIRTKLNDKTTKES